MSSDLEGNVGEAKRLYAGKFYRECTQVLEGSLSDAASQGPILLAELHLLLAKCYKGLDDLKNAILSCNSAIDHRPHWKDPFLYRSACFQAFHARLLETDGEDLAHIERDRNEADIVVGPQVQGSNQKFFSQIDEALSAAKDGDKIFIEPGQYDVTSLFLFGKTVSLIGASVKRCVLLYKKQNVASSAQGGSKESRLETFLICTSGSVPSLIKRLTFRSANPPEVKTKFLGIAGGTVQLEDCLFDGGESAEVGAVYTNAKICGNLASNYPSPRVIARFCVFDRCTAFGAFTALHSCGALHCSYFVGCGRSCVAALDSAKVSLANCELAMTEISEQTVGATSSDLTVTGCHFHGAPSVASRSSYAIGVTLKSVANVTKNYIHLTGNGISCIDSDLACSQNVIVSCSQKYSQNNAASAMHSTLGLLSGVTLRQKARVTLSDNHIERCDVGVYVGDGAMPVIKENVLRSSFFAAIFAESCSKPSIVGNTLDGGSKEVGLQSGVGSGLGVLLLADSAGMIGKNSFVNFCVSPIMAFSRWGNISTFSMSLCQSLS